MNLTAGTTLQNRKYVIQKLLHQSDLGVTYEAQHAYLDQTVVLQTFNDVVRQRRDFDQLRQQFLSKVRSLVQQPQAHSVRVLDCFEEGEMPFIVLEIAPNQPLPLLTDWLPIVADATDATVEETIAPTQLNSSEADLPASANPPQSVAEPLADVLLGQMQKTSSHGAVAVTVGGADEETQPPTPGYEAGAEAAKYVPQRSPVTQKQSFTVPVPATIPAATVIGTQVVQRPVIPARQRSKAWMPLSLIFLSITGAIVGAGFGLSLRLAPTQPSTATTEASPVPKSRLFSREQSFPSDADWPITETPESYTADPTPIEEPVYRVPAIESYTPPELPDLPTDYQDPYLTPSPSPAVSTATPTPDQQPAPLPDALIEDASAPITTTPPQISAPPLPLEPEAVEPSLPQLAEPSEPVAPPALEEPVSPILPPTDPAVIKQ